MLLFEERHAGQDRWYQRQTFFEKVVFHPDLLERWAGKNTEQKPRRSNLCISRYYLASARGLTFAQTSLEVSPALFSQGSSGSAPCGDKFKQVGPVRRLLGKNAAPSCLSYAFSHCFMAEALMFPNTGALLSRRTDSSVKSQLEADWKDTRTVSELNFHRSSSQLSPDFYTCTTTNSDLLYHHICVCARELHSFTPTQHSKYWAVAWAQCLLRSVWGA